MIMKANHGGDDDSDFNDDDFSDGPEGLEPIFWIRPVETNAEFKRFDEPAPQMLRRKLQSEFARKYVAKQ